MTVRLLFFAALREGEGSSKLTFVKLGWGDFESKYTFLTAIGGFLLIGIGAYGTDQDMTQRVLTCKSAARGTASTIAGILIGIPVTLLFMVVGLLPAARPDGHGGTSAAR